MQNLLIYLHYGFIEKSRNTVAGTSGKGDHQLSPDPFSDAQVRQFSAAASCICCGRTRQIARKLRQVSGTPCMYTIL
jgi:hypothetical protein